MAAKMPRKAREPVVMIKHLDWSYRQPLKNPGPAVLAYLVRRANKDARCWPEQRLIASALAISTRTVVRVIRVLKLCGLVNVIRQEKRGRGKAGVKNTYLLNYSVNVTPEGAKHAEKIARALDQSDTVSLRTDPTKVTNLHDQSDKGNTEEIQEETLHVTTALSKLGVRGVWSGKILDGDFR